MIPANIHIKNCSSEFVWCSVQRCPMKPCGTNWVNVPCEPLKRETFSAQNKSSPDFYLHFMPRQGEKCQSFHNRDLHIFFFTLIGVSHTGTRLREELPSTPECPWAKRNLSAPEGGVESQKARCVGFNVHRQTNVPGWNARVTWVQLFVWGRKWCF